MAYGILIKNNNGETLIDGEYPLLSLVATVEQSIAAGKVDGPDPYEWRYRENIVKVPHYGAADIIPFLCPQYGMNFGITGMKRTSTHIELGVVAKSGGTLRVELYSYADFATSLQGEFGVQVFNAGGRLCFDSRNPPLRPYSFLQGQFNIALPGRSGQPYGISADAMLKHAWAMIEYPSTGMYHDYSEWRVTSWLRWQSDRMIFESPQYADNYSGSYKDELNYFGFNYGEGTWGDPGGYLGPGVTYSWHVISGGIATMGATLAYAYDGIAL